MNIFNLMRFVRRKARKTTTQRLIDELETQHQTLEGGFFSDATPAARMLAAAALGSMKAIIRQLKRNARPDNSLKGTQAEDLPAYLAGKKYE